MTEAERRDIFRMAQLLQPYGDEFLRDRGLTWLDLIDVAPPKSTPAPPWPYPLPPERPMVATMEEWRAIYAPKPIDNDGRWSAVLYFIACAVALFLCLVASVRG
jgi:hypothetical protein